MLYIGIFGYGRLALTHTHTHTHTIAHTHTSQRTHTFADMWLVFSTFETSVSMLQQSTQRPVSLWACVPVSLWACVHVQSAGSYTCFAVFQSSYRLSVRMYRGEITLRLAKLTLHQWTKWISFITNKNFLKFFFMFQHNFCVLTFCYSFFKRWIFLAKICLFQSLFYFIASHLNEASEQYLVGWKFGEKRSNALSTQELWSFHRQDCACSELIEI